MELAEWRPDALVMPFSVRPSRPSPGSLRRRSDPRVGNCAHRRRGPQGEAGRLR
jgi:hypothetical protein